MIDAYDIYDYTFTWSHRIATELQKEGINNVYYLPFAYDSTIYPVNSNVEKGNWKYDVSFVGTYDKEREDYLVELSDLQLAIWGPYWQRAKTPKLKSMVYGTFANINTMMQLYTSSKICLNIMRPQNSSSHNMKTFEIPALGGFLLTQDTLEHRQIFPNNSIGLFQNKNDFRNKVLDYLSDDDNRIVMMKNAMKLVLEKNTYINRAKYVLSVIN